ncbi:MAG: PEGA domain-containing protein [Patescibacteria group bacterium]|nr:PEGA domain-containing protein [Patescibacteria group bacterium]
MKSFFKSLVQFLAGLAVGCVVWYAVWHYYGYTEVTATFDGSKIDGALVYIDGKQVGKTPYKERLYPGFHNIEVRPPQGYDSTLSSQTWYYFTAARGDDLVAKFETPEIYAVPEDELVVR